MPRGRKAVDAEIERMLDEEDGLPPKKIKTPKNNAVMHGRVVEASVGGVEEVSVGDQLTDPYEENAAYGLTKTQTPGVYVNSAGVLVDVNGVMLDFKTVQEKDQERFERVIGEKVDTPAKLLKAVALDPTQPLDRRMEAAKAAAPYTDKKVPTKMEVESSQGVPIMSVQQLRGLSVEELRQLKFLLMKSAGTPEAMDVPFVETGVKVLQ